MGYYYVRAGQCAFFNGRKYENYSIFLSIKYSYFQEMKLTTIIGGVMIRHQYGKSLLASEMASADLGFSVSVPRLTKSCLHFSIFVWHFI